MVLMLKSNDINGISQNIEYTHSTLVIMIIVTIELLSNKYYVSHRGNTADLNTTDVLPNGVRKSEIRTSKGSHNLAPFLTMAYKQALYYHNLREDKGN